MFSFDPLRVVILQRRHERVVLLSKEEMGALTLFDGQGQEVARIAEREERHIAGQEDQRAIIPQKQWHLRVIGHISARIELLKVTPGERKVAVMSLSLVRPEVEQDGGNGYHEDRNQKTEVRNQRTSPELGKCGP